MIKRLQDIDVNGKRVLVRFDLNLPINEEGVVTETTRLSRVKPTVDYLRKHGAKTIVMAHLGRPQGEDSSLSLAQIIDEAQKQWETSVAFCPAFSGDKAAQAIAGMHDGDVLMLENIRFDPREEKNDPSFVKELAALGDIYINDGFSVAHRAHASTEGLAHVLPSAAGISMQKEIDAIASAVENPRRPVMAVIGGSKVSTKLAVLENLAARVDYLVIGGGMANTFLLAQGHDIGASLAEPDLVNTAKRVMATAEAHECKIILPVDVTATLSLDAPTDIYRGALSDLPQGYKIVDIGEKTAEEIVATMNQCKTIVWNGPLGVFERPPFDIGTVKVARAMAQAVHERGVTAVAGGGDTLSAVDLAGLKDEDFTYLSTAGGAFLEWLEGKVLPGLAALKA